MSLASLGLILAVIVLSTLVASLTDWLFMDVLVHRFYAVSPALWRPQGGTARIVLSQLIGSAATASLVLLCLSGVKPFRAVLLVWLAGALPVTLQNLQWMILPPPIAASHAAGWLVRLGIAALFYRLILT
jgi:hypothetical protein